MTEQTTEEPNETEQVFSSEQVVPEVPPVTGVTPDHPAEGGTDVPPDEDPETFPREYVVKLRDEAAKHRTKAQRADDLAARLHTSLVAATGRLADPSDLAFDDAHLDDEGALTAAIDDLLSRKPHLATRKPSGDVGQGASVSGDTVDLAGILRSRA